MRLKPRRQTLAGVLYALGLVHLWGLLRRWQRRGPPIFLTGHRVVPQGVGDAVERMALLSGHAITPQELQRRLLFLQRWVMPAGQPDELTSGVGDSRRFYLTFDDGYRDNLEHAAPVLRRLGVRAVIFIVADLIAHPRAQPWWDRWGAESLRQHPQPQAALEHYNQRCVQAKRSFQGLDEEDLKPGNVQRYLDAQELAALPPQFHVANHTRSHANLTCLEPALQAQHIAAGEQALIQHPRYLPWLAFPFGTRNEALLGQLRQGMGVQLAFATGAGVDGDRYQVRRLNLNLRHFALFAAQAVGLMR